MKIYRHNFYIVAVVLTGLICSTYAGSTKQVGSSTSSKVEAGLPKLKPDISPLARENEPLLFKRFVAAFDKQYAIHTLNNKQRNLAEGYTVYFLRQELQALVDMWRATGKLTYLQQAKKQIVKAIADASSSPRPLLLHNKPRGNWPCFLLKSVEKQTGGHNQICDFQGAAGFLLVATALKEADQDGWQEIADFVEKSIVEKWLLYRPSVRLGHLKGPESNKYLLVVLDLARDKREHFTTICMDLHKLGYNKYPYEKWAKFLTKLYVGERPSLDADAPDSDKLGQLKPEDWGLLPRKSSGGYVWHFIPDWKQKQKIAVLDTAHANRTVWLATKAYSEGLVDKAIVDGFAKTLKKQIWKPQKSPFYFANFIDGNDAPYNDSKYGELPPGFKGHVWFGWHRLAAYDDDLKELFLSLAYDLTNGGPNMPASQNKTMANAPLCFYAWGARLLADNGNPQVFP